MHTQAQFSNRNSKRSPLLQVSRLQWNERDPSASTGARKNSLAHPHFEISLKDRPTQKKQYSAQINISKNSHRFARLEYESSSDSQELYDVLGADGKRSTLVTAGNSQSFLDTYANGTRARIRVSVETAPATCMRRRRFPNVTPSAALYCKSRALSEMREIILRRLARTRTF